MFDYELKKETAAKCVSEKSFSVSCRADDVCPGDFSLSENFDNQTFTVQSISHFPAAENFEIPVRKINADKVVSIQSKHTKHSFISVRYCKANTYVIVKRKLQYFCITINVLTDVFHLLVRRIHKLIHNMKGNNAVAGIYALRLLRL